jgi:hypothetical protein
VLANARDLCSPIINTLFNSPCAQETDIRGAEEFAHACTKLENIVPLLEISENAWKGGWVARFEFLHDQFAMCFQFQECVVCKEMMTVTDFYGDYHFLCFKCLVHTCWLSNLANKKDTHCPTCNAIHSIRQIANRYHKRVLKYLPSMDC